MPCLPKRFLPKVDGIVTRLRHTIEHLERNGDRVLVVAPEGGLTEYKGAKVYGVPGMPLPLYPELKLALPPLGTKSANRAVQSRSDSCC